MAFGFGCRISSSTRTNLFDHVSIRCWRTNVFSDKTQQIELIYIVKLNIVLNCPDCPEL